MLMIFEMVRQKDYLRSEACESKTCILLQSIHTSWLAVKLPKSGFKTNLHSFIEDKQI